MACAKRSREGLPAGHGQCQPHGEEGQPVEEVDGDHVANEKVGDLIHSGLFLAPGDLLAAAGRSWQGGLAAHQYETLHRHHQVAGLVGHPVSDLMLPRSGLLCDGRFSSTRMRAVSVSPGRTGRSQRICSTPGEPMLSAWLRKPSTSRRMVKRARVPPAGDDPAKIDASAASGSM